MLPKKRVGRTIAQVKKRKYLAYSREIKLWLKENKGSVIPVARWIMQHFEEFKNAKKGYHRSVGSFRVARDYTGSAKGGNNIMTLRVNFGNTAFFVKLQKESVKSGPKVVADYYDLVEELKRRNFMWGDWKLAALKPHIVYSTVVNRERLVFEASDFVFGLPLGTDSEYKPVVHNLGRSMRDKFSDVGAQNTFIDSKTHTIYLFDPR